MSSNPYVGEVVHYVSYGTPGGEYESQCRAAIVTEFANRNEKGEVSNFPLVSLAVLNPTGMFFNQNLPYAPQGPLKGGTWHFNCGRTSLPEVADEF